MSKIMNFDNYLKKFITKKGNPYTHTKIGNKDLNIIGGSYYIPENEMTDFYNRYYSSVFEEDNTAYLTEKQLIEDGPILIDVDLRYDTTIKTRQHTKDHVLDLIMIYSAKMLEVFNFTENVKIPIYVMQKNDVNILDDKTKDGIHIIIGLKAHKAAQVILREKLIADLTNIWSDLPFTNTMEDVIDLGITKGFVNWQLFGSQKPGNKAYKLDSQWEIEYIPEDNDWLVDEIKKPFNYEKNLHRLSAQYRDYQEFAIKEKMLTQYQIEKDNITKKALPKVKTNSLLPIVQNKSINNINLGEKEFKSIKNQDMLDEFIINIFDNINANDYELKETHDFTMILPVSYYGPGSYNKWIRVGWALKNTSVKLFLSWIKFSSQSKEFRYADIDELYDLWETFDTDNADGLTSRSIMYWAKNDASNEYSMIRKETISYFIEETVKTSAEWDLANVLYQIYKDQFICVSIKNNGWYEYKKHRWCEIDSGNTLRLLISKSMHDIYMKKIAEITISLRGLDQGEKAYETLRSRNNKLTDICSLLKRTTSKNNIMREARELFYDKTFLNKLDNNPYLLCFNNYVVDFKHAKVRMGQPDDYLSKCTNIDYVAISDPKFSKTRDEINLFIDQIFPNEELRDYMWQHLASCLIGTNENQTFNIYTGSGCNGKSKLVDLMSKGMGDYKATVPITMITQGRKSIGSTSSEVVQLKGIRYAVMQEPSKGDKINEGIMKEITGGDPIQGRALFQESITFMPQFKLVVCTNTLFDIKSNDDGTWRRIRVCDFMSKFVDNPFRDEDKFPADNFPYQFKIDKKIDEKFAVWAPIFMSMLIEVGFKTKGNVKDTQIVLAKSDKYREGQDYLSEFAKEKIIKKTDSKVKKTELIEEFKNWYSNQYGRASLPNSREITDFMEKKYGKHVSGKWHNVAIVYDDQEDLKMDD